VVLSALAVALVLAGCTGQSQQQTAEEEVLVLKPGQDLNDLFGMSDTDVGSEVSPEEDGSVKVTVTKSQSVPLYDAGDLDVENATLTYRAKLRCEELEGRAYLEMWCTFGEMGDYFARGLDSAVGGTTDWTSVATSFFLQAGENPTNVRLNVVVDGTGTVWVDDLEIVESPLPG
jgi:hypothetical protein